MKFEDAQKFMIKYLSSSKFANREDAQTTLSSLSLITDMVKHGFITENSQEGVQIKGKKYITNEPFVINERAYVCGFMREFDGELFMRLFSSKSDKVCLIIPRLNIQESDINFDKNKNIPLTVSIKSDNKYKVYTSQTTWLPAFIYDLKKQHVKLNKSEKVVYILCYDPLYNRKASSKNGLHNDILKILHEMNEIK
jgi:hypothetical protein